MKSDRLGQSLPVRGGLSGSNDDSSVVSLKALVAKADANSPAARAASFEDSGLIDLKQLMANAPPPSSDALPPVLAPDEAGLFAAPEATLTPHVAPATSLASETAPASSSSAKWLVAALVTIVAAGGTIGALYAKTPSVAEARPGIAAVVPPKPSEPEKFVEAQPPAQPAPAATTATSAAANTAAVTPTHPSRQASSKPAARERAGHDAPAAPSKVETKPPAADPCDLMCQMQRASQKKH